MPTSKLMRRLREFWKAQKYLTDDEVESSKDHKVLVLYPDSSAGEKKISIDSN